jgi:(2Fe-2S) ferredoxin
MSKFNKDTIIAIHNQETAEQPDYISVGMSACGIAAGAQEVYDVFAKQIKSRNFTIKLRKCGCAGMCYAEPLVEVKANGMPVVTYGRVTEEIAQLILEKHVANSILVNDCVVNIR